MAELWSQRLIICVMECEQPRSGPALPFGARFHLEQAAGFSWKRRSLLGLRVPSPTPTPAGAVRHGSSFPLTHPLPRSPQWLVNVSRPGRLLPHANPWSWRKEAQGEPGLRMLLCSHQLPLPSAMGCDVPHRLLRQRVPGPTTPCRELAEAQEGSGSVSGTSSG